MGSARRLILFLVLLLLILGGLEIFVRVNGPSFEALADRLSLRIRIFERSPEDTAALFLGTSRFADAIDQTVFGEAVEDRTGDFVRVVNGATAGIAQEEIVIFSEVVAERGTLPCVVIEASGSSLPEGSGRVVVAGDGEIEIDRDGRFADRLEGEFQGWLGENLALVRYRKALRPRTLVKLGVLYTANHIDPGKWSRKGFVRELFTSSDFSLPEETMDALQPLRYDRERLPAAGTAEGEAEGIPEPVEQHPIYRGMAEIARSLEDSDTEIVWVNPPVMGEMQEGENNPVRLAIYRRILEDFGGTILDYSQLELAAGLYRDRSHLNEKGRTLFSRLVARDLADRF